MDNLVQRFECPICLASYHYCIPKLLPCVHTVCEQCLSGLIDVGKGRKFKCPVCREEIKVPKGGIRGFRTNIYLVPDKDKAAKAKVCSFCAEDSKQSIHLKCGHHLCNVCAKQKKSLPSHPGNSTDDCPVCINEVPKLPPRNIMAPAPTPNAQVPGQWPPTSPSYIVWPGQGPLPAVTQWPTHSGQYPSPFPPQMHSVGPTGQSLIPNMQQCDNLPPLPVRSVTSPTSPTAPPIELYDDGYDEIKNIPDRLEGEEWYCGEISRDTSNEILYNMRKDGSFLVRKTIKEDPSHKYTLDFLYDNTDYHLKIRTRPDGRYYLPNLTVAKHFEDVQSLVSYYKREPLVIDERRTKKEFHLTLKS